MKEGVEDDMKFEVLECRYNKGRLEYHRVAVIRPVKNRIWDNRFNALMEGDSDNMSGTLFHIDPVDKTKIKDIQPGMLIRQING